MASTTFGVLGHLDVSMGLGLLRLSTEGRPDEPQAIALIHHALNHGIRLLDTADSYALSDSDFHYGEKLARKAVDSWDGPRDEVRIITKAGMARPKGRWVPNARPEHLRKTVEASLKALGGDGIFMLMLHGNDPGTPFEESLATLAELQRNGLIEHLGLCNAEIAEVRQAQRHFTVAAIQNELSVINRKGATDGVLELARQLAIPFLAHRPLGGHSKVDTLEKNRAMKPIADKHGITRHEAALATLLDLGWPVIPLIGATKLASLDSSLRALSVRLDDKDRAAVAEKITFEATPEALAETIPHVIPANLRTLHMGDTPGTEPEVVIIMGVQGAGKSSLVNKYVDAGFARLNRDIHGGNLEDLIPLLAHQLTSENKRVVLDNTYPTRLSRHPVIRTAHGHGVPVRCIYLATPVKEALINIVNRVLDRYERLLGPEELKELSKTDPNLPPPLVLPRWAACFEAPALDEGFGVVEEVPFERRPGPVSGSGKGLLLDVDGTLRRTKSGEIYPREPDDIEIIPGRREVLEKWLADGYKLFFVSNQSGVASGNVSTEAVDACFARTIELLALPITEVAYCPHSAFPVGCFCRKPMPGLGVYLARKHQLAMSELIMVGDMDSDADFAKAIGARYVHADEFFQAM